MPPHKPTMGIVSLNWHYIMGKVIAEYVRKIEQISSYSCNCQMKGEGIFVVLMDGDSKNIARLKSR